MRAFAALRAEGSLRMAGCRLRLSSPISAERSCSTVPCEKSLDNQTTSARTHLFFTILREISSCSKSFDMFFNLPFSGFPKVYTAFTLFWTRIVSKLLYCVLSAYSILQIHNPSESKQKQLAIAITVTVFNVGNIDCSRVLRRTLESHPLPKWSYFRVIQC